MLLGCSHFPSCAFKSKCENSTLALLQRFVLLELSELSWCAFSQSVNYFHMQCRWWYFLHPLRRNKGQIFQPIAQAWHRNEAPKSAFWFVSSTYWLHRYWCLIGTGFRYPNTLTKIINATLLFLPPFLMSWTQRSKTFSMYTKGLFLSNIVHKSV